MHAPETPISHEERGACLRCSGLSHFNCGQAVKVWRLTAREEIGGERPLFWYKIYSVLYFCWKMRQLRSVARGILGSYVHDCRIYRMYEPLFRIVDSYVNKLASKKNKRV